jgi:hypothetical protein
MTTISCNLSAVNEREVWYLNSSASMHMMCQKEWLHDFNMTAMRDIMLGDNSVIQVAGKGTIQALTQVNNDEIRIELHSVLYVLKLAKNLISTSGITGHNYSATIDASGCLITHKVTGNPCLQARSHGSRLVGDLNIEHTSDQASFTKVNTPSLELLHQQLGHPSAERMKATANQAGITTKGKLPDCIMCTPAKQTRPDIRAGPVPKASKPMAVLHSNMCGPINVPTFSDKCYFITVIDKATPYAVAYLIKTKKEVKTSIRHFITRSPHHSCCHKLHTDQGGEHLSHKLSGWPTRALSTP